MIKLTQSERDHGQTAVGFKFINLLWWKWTDKWKKKL